MISQSCHVFPLCPVLAAWQPSSLLLALLAWLSSDHTVRTVANLLGPVTTATASSTGKSTGPKRVLSEYIQHKKNLYIQKRIFEIKQEGHLSGEKELRPMLMPLLILYSLGILLVAFLVYIFVKP